jgi:hypothetical protein
MGQAFYPQRLSRGLALVKWWLLALPHYVVAGFFFGGVETVVWRYSETGAVNVGVKSGHSAHRDDDHGEVPYSQRVRQNDRTGQPIKRSLPACDH